MKQELNIGDEVLIFKYYRLAGYQIEPDDEHYKKGIVIKSELSDDLSYHGSAWHVMNYTVLGENGKEYFGNYLTPELGNSYFMTREDYIDYMSRKIEINTDKIVKLESENQKFLKIIDTVKMQEQENRKTLVRKKNV